MNKHKVNFVSLRIFFCGLIIFSILVKYISFNLLSGSEFFVIKLVIALVAHSEREIYSLYVLTVISLFLPPIMTIAFLAHSFGIMSLVSVFAFCDGSFFIAGLSHDLLCG